MLNIIIIDKILKWKENSYLMTFLFTFIMKSVKNDYHHLIFILLINVTVLQTCPDILSSATLINDLDNKMRFTQVIMHLYTCAVVQLVLSQIFTCLVDLCCHFSTKISYCNSQNKASHKK